MKSPTVYDYCFTFSLIANVVLFWAVMLSSKDKQPYNDYRECIKYANEQTCFLKTIDVQK